MVLVGFGVGARQVKRARPGRALPLLLASKGILCAADGVLHLTCKLIRLAFRFELRIAGDLASHLLDGALRLLD